MSERRDGARIDDPARTSDTGETLAGFSDWRPIGRGGDAIVYRARQDALGRDVAIKVLTVDDDESAVRRFTREVQLMVSLGRQHPNIANVLQIGTSSLGRPCIVMDYYELGSLDQKLGRVGPLSGGEVIRAGTVISDALSFAHANGVLHRDVKPQNILVLPTSYVLADFGIARLIESAHTAGSDRFSHRHASPQVLDGFPPSESDDIFSLGATLFHLLDGQPPFATEQPCSALAYIQRVRLEQPRPLNRPDLSPRLVEVIARCLRKDPAERFGSAAEVRDALATLSRVWPASLTAIATPSGDEPPAAAGPAYKAPHMHAEWGVAPEQVNDADDLTTGRLAQPQQAPGASPRPTVRRRSRVGIVVGGALAGIAIVLAGSLVGRSGPTPTTVSPQSTSAGTTHNPDLAPRNLRVTIAGDTATATWQGSLDEPEAYGWGLSANPLRETPIERTSLPSERIARATIDPSWNQVCFTVVGMRGDQLGGAQDCARR